MILFALFLTFGRGFSGSPLPDGWRVPTEKETVYDIPLRDEDTNRYLFTEADFNGDGKIDVARILVNDKKNKMALFVFLSSDANHEAILLTEFDDKSWAGIMGVSKVEPGEYKTACGKGYWECSEGVPEVLILKRPAINLFKFESASSFFFWDEFSKSFKRIWMSD